MKIMIVSTPIRPVPTPFPPFGSLALVKYLRKNGIEDVSFYNIDGNRPDYDDVLAHIEAEKPDLVGISAVVSTAYEYSKRLSLDIKRILPDSMIVLGGNMGASANVLLRKTGVDMCILGEGEAIFLDVIRRSETTRIPHEFKDITGLTLLDENGLLINTGYREQLEADELYDIDWSDLEATSEINHYFQWADDNTTATAHFERDVRFFEDKHRNKRIGYLYTSKGCVSRCTFCHRWDKGIRFIPVDIVMQRVDEIIDRYDVGFLSVADENFGTNKRWLAEFCAEMKKRGILWHAGTRAKGVDPDSIAMMHDSGCTALVYGNETGSERMLQIMEKKVSIEDNYNAVKWTIDQGMGSTVQLVCGMPGETPETIAETIEFCKFTNSISPIQNPNDLSINYAQALPGTPLYEYGRRKGLIGKDLNGEEEYLLAISDRDAHDEYTTLNFTDYPKLMCETWRPRITIEVNYHYIKKFGRDAYFRVMNRDTKFFTKGGQESGYFANPRRLIESAPDTLSTLDDDFHRPALLPLVLTGKFGLAIICYPELTYRVRRVLLLLVILKNIRESGFGPTWRLLKEYLAYRTSRLLNASKFAHEYQSLRKIVGESADLTSGGDDNAMAALRKGR
jgi:anaerobic magnesium-protoporphyrin IX monomethyl ester cyclase